MEMVRAIDEAEQRLEGIASTTPLQPSIRLSEQYGATILIKREDMQAVRSFKIRGAYNKIASLSPTIASAPLYAPAPATTPRVSPSPAPTSGSARRSSCHGSP